MIIMIFLKFVVTIHSSIEFAPGSMYTFLLYEILGSTVKKYTCFLAPTNYSIFLAMNCNINYMLDYFFIKVISIMN